MNVRNTGSTLDSGTWYTWCEIQDMIKRATGFRPTTAQSVLPGPLQTWKAGKLVQYINCGLYPPFVGAFGAARVDFVNMKPLNPLFAWRTEPEMG